MQFANKLRNNAIIKWYCQLPLMLRRTIRLAVALAFGLLLAKGISGPLQGWLDVMPVKIGETKLNIGGMQLAIFIMYLPVLYVLWQFRTADTQKQIQKAQENVEKAQGNLNANLLGLYLKMLLSKDLEERCIGLVRLATLKQQGVFAKEIDSATRRRLDLNHAEMEGEDLSNVNLKYVLLNEANLEGTILCKAYLRHAQMKGAKLFRVNLQEADLVEADLEGADMRGVDLNGADLNGANLESADLRGADLSSAKNLDKAKLANAKYDDVLMKFPKGFSPSKMGMEAMSSRDSNGNHG